MPRDHALAPPGKEAGFPFLSILAFALQFCVPVSTVSLLSGCITLAPFE